MERSFRRLSFGPVWLLVLLARVEIRVVNRQGQPVYQASGYQRGKGWNRAYKGYVLPAGTYYYVIDLKNGQPKLSGAVTLLK